MIVAAAQELPIAVSVMGDVQDRGTIGDTLADEHAGMAILAERERLGTRMVVAHRGLFILGDWPALGTA